MARRDIITLTAREIMTLKAILRVLSASEKSGEASISPETRLTSEKGLYFILPKFCSTIWRTVWVIVITTNTTAAITPGLEVQIPSEIKTHTAKTI